MHLLPIQQIQFEPWEHWVWGSYKKPGQGDVALGHKTFLPSDFKVHLQCPHPYCSFCKSSCQSQIFSQPSTHLILHIWFLLPTMYVSHSNIRECLGLIQLPFLWNSSLTFLKSVSGILQQGTDIPEIYLHEIAIISLHSFSSRMRVPWGDTKE